MTMSGSAAHQIFTVWHKFRSRFMPVPEHSNFVERGELTPDEFVQAGDLLVEKCRTWQWSGGEDRKKLDFLPPDKQFLITKNVPCLKRCSDLLQEADDEEEVGDGWVATHLEFVKNQEEEHIEDISAPADISSAQPAAPESDSDEYSEEEEEDSDDDVVDINAFNQDGATAWDEQEDGAVAAPAKRAPNSNVLRTRTYDLSITYDIYYKTPRVWLFGYDENGRALSVKQVLEDIHVDYSNKTVTLEAHPHLNRRCAGIHPCKHASLMKKMVDLQIAAHDGLCPRVDLYLFIFLKFISSVIPTIVYDFTVSTQS